MGLVNLFKVMGQPRKFGETDYISLHSRV
jgi:hypothetical protein